MLKSNYLDYIKYEKANRISSEKTVNTYVRGINLFAELMFDKSFDELTIEDMLTVDKMTLALFKRKLQDRGVSTSTIKARFAALKSLMDYMVEFDIIDEDNKTYLNLKRKQSELNYIPQQEKNLTEAKKTILPLEEVEGIFNYIDIEIDYKNRNRYKLIFSCMFELGLRVEETINIQLSHIDLDSKILNIVSGKGKKDRVVCLSDNWITIYTRYMEDRDKHFGIYAKEYLFCSNRSARISKRTVQSYMSEILNQVSRDHNITCHSLRRTFATNNSDKDLVALQKALGHSNLSTTSIYIMDKKEDVKRLYDNSKTSEALKEVIG